MVSRSDSLMPLPGPQIGPGGDCSFLCADPPPGRPRHRPGRSSAPRGRESAAPHGCARPNPSPLPPPGESGQRYPPGGPRTARDPAPVDAAPPGRTEPSHRRPATGPPRPGNVLSAAGAAARLPIRWASFPSRRASWSFHQVRITVASAAASRAGDPSQQVFFRQGWTGQGQSGKVPPVSGRARRMARKTKS